MKQANWNTETEDDVAVDGAQDIELECIERSCREPFIWSVGEQKFFRSKGYNRPKRCVKCRAARREQKADL